MLALYLVSSILVILAILITAIVFIDIFLFKPQKMKIMNIVWPITMLWSSFIGWIFYLKVIKKKRKDKNQGMMNMSSKNDTSHEKMSMNNMSMNNMPMGDMASMNDMPMSNMSSMDMSTTNNMKKIKASSIALSTLHCGAGCTLADIIGELITARYPIVLWGSSLWGGWVFDYILAIIIGVYFQYAAIKQMQPNLSRMTIIGRAFKSDLLSLTAWQIGMYAWLAIVFFVFFPNGEIHKGGWIFWFMMQIAMVCGFITSYPMNYILIKLGIKKSSM